MGNLNKNMHILINGGTGFIGSKLCEHFNAQGFRVAILTRHIHRADVPKSAILIDNLNDEEISYDVIINLAGEPLNKNRWNDRVKKVIYDSRIQSTQNIVDYIKTAKVKPNLLVTSSAIGFYGSSSTKNFSEDTKPADHSFIHKICADLEAEGMKASEYGVRVCIIRTGIVLGKNKGALAELLPPFKLGLGAQLGNGKQWMSWIHIDDVVGVIDFLVQNVELGGPFNLASPGTVTNAQFTKELARALKRPSFLKLPDFMVKLLFGEMGEALLLKGQRVIPHNLMKAGYKFKFPTLEGALEDIFDK
jgi:uncharacterized protein (TIGR01777 family)